MKLICIAPKLGAPDVPVNNGPTVGVNTSDRNSTADALEGLSSGQSDSPIGVQHASANGNGSNGGDTAQQNAIGSQLETDIGSLHLTAPGTSRDAKAQSNSEDNGSVDVVAKAEQEERFGR